MTTQSVSGAIWQKRTLDQVPFELNAVNGHEHVVIRVSRVILPDVTYKVPSEQGFELMSKAPKMTDAQVRDALRLAGDELEVMTR